MLVSSEASPFLLYVHVHVYVYHVHIHFFYPTVLLAVLLSWCSSFLPDGAILCLILVSLSSSGGLSFHILTSSHPHIPTFPHSHIPTSPAHTNGDPSPLDQIARSCQLVCPSSNIALTTKVAWGITGFRYS